MFEVRRVLCPVDFSEFSRRALQHAARLAHWYGAEVHVLHVDPALPSLWPVAPGLDTPAAGVTVPAALSRALAAFVDPLRDTGVALEGHVALGDVTARILDYARGKRVDLLVMGTHGRGGLERLVLGSVAESVLRKSPCPVITTRLADAPFLREGAPFRSIVCAVDFSPPSLAALRHALSLAAEGDARLTLLHVLEGDADTVPRTPADPRIEAPRGSAAADARERLHAALPPRAGDWCRPRGVVAAGRVHEQALRVADECSAELIVVGVHGRPALDVMLFGSNTVRIVRAAKCPVLTVSAGPVDPAHGEEHEVAGHATRA
jgi:nucleotide-binding universal stress UspA family protein